MLCCLATHEEFMPAMIASCHGSSQSGISKKVQKQMGSGGLKSCEEDAAAHTVAQPLAFVSTHRRLQRLSCFESFRPKQ